MTRKYNITNKVGCPIKYGRTDLINIINKTKTDKEFAKLYNVSTGTIQAIRCYQSKILGIPIKDWNKNQHYRGNKL